MNRRKKRHKPLFLRIWFWLLLVLLMVAALAVGGWQWLEKESQVYRARAASYDLERINDLEIPSLILDRNGVEIGRVFVQNRSLVTIDKVSDVFLDALRAGEDQRFDNHKGVDFIGVARAAWLNWKAGETTQGASTITQQLARNAYNLEGDRQQRGESPYQRKIVEAFLAHRIEQNFSKRQILEFYLNRIYFGSGYYGIRSASLGYFGKEPSELNTLESAAIVGCIKNPSNLSPLKHEAANRKARNMVLSRMVNLGMLAQDEAESLMQSPLPLNPRPLRRGTSHLYERIADEVNRQLGEDALAAGGFRIHTTILADAQKAAFESLRKSLDRAESHPGYKREKRGKSPKQPAGNNPPDFLQGAVLMVDHSNGDILAYVGGRDYARVPYDFIELGKRPLGTAFFPFLYAAGFERGLSPVTTIEDEPMDNRSVMIGGREGILGEWGMEVDAPVYEGMITARRALEQSKIAASVRFMEKIGLKQVVKSACDFGLPLENAELLRRIAVGFDEVSLKQAVRAISTFAKSGELGPKTLHLLDRVEAPDGSVPYRRVRPQETPTQVIDSATAWQIHSILAGSLEHGSSAGALTALVEKPFHGAGKGGSTHDFSDCWFLGYNSRVSCGVWTGFLDAGTDPIYPGAFSRDLALPVWVATMNAAAPSFGGNPIPPPENLVKATVCSQSGQRPTPYCQKHVGDPTTGFIESASTSITEYFRAGTEPSAFCELHFGGGSDSSPGTSMILGRPILNVAPVIPTESVLVGEDPYHTDLPGPSGHETASGWSRRPTNVLDSLDLGEVEESIPLRRPQRLEIHDD